MNFKEACERGNINEVDALTRNGQQNIQLGLSLAAKNGHRAVCDLLIGLGASVCFEDIMVSAREGFINTTKDLAMAFVRQNGKSDFSALIKSAEAFGLRRTARALKEAQYGR